MEKYTYLSNKWKKDFAHLALANGCLLTTEMVEEWNHENQLGLKIYQLDDLLHLDVETIKEWNKL